ncbi:MAG: L,D-transpeptidase family protein [Gammaproteobacteria bacterium]|nr:L,D-transpeptidase family protein [Gammaproteobacteria bacterium]
MRLIFLFLICFSPITWALTFQLPPQGSDIVGHIRKITLSKHANIDDLSRKYEVGYYEFLEANPNININRLNTGDTLTIPSEYIFPDAPRQGIVINLSELRLYYFLPKQRLVLTYPIGIGKEGDETPVVETTIIGKEENPYWRPTPKTRNEFLYNTGLELPEEIDPGEGNPLGDYMMRLGNWIYLIHGTNNPNGVGKRSSGGCIRMYPESIATLFPLVPIGTLVDIVKEPIKVGWRGNQLYLESHVPMEVKSYRGKEDLQSLIALVTPVLRRRRAEINWDKALRVANQQTGIPTVIGRAI